MAKKTKEVAEKTEQPKPMAHLPLEIYNAVAEYILNRPYKEVAGLVEALKSVKVS